MKKTISILILFYSIYSFSQNDINNNDNKIYNFTGIQQKPEFPGGVEKLKAFVNDNLIKAGFEGITNSNVKTNAVSIFIVEKDGTLNDIKVYGKINSAKSEEVIKILKKSPIWNPGKQNTKIVRVNFALPLN